MLDWVADLVSLLDGPASQQSEPRTLHEAQVRFFLRLLWSLVGLGALLGGAAIAILIDRPFATEAGLAAAVLGFIIVFPSYSRLRQLARSIRRLSA